jgi:hypothetical protein
MSILLRVPEATTVSEVTVGFDNKETPLFALIHSIDWKTWITGGRHVSVGQFERAVHSVTSVSI